MDAQSGGGNVYFLEIRMITRMSLKYNLHSRKHTGIILPAKTVSLIIYGLLGNMDPMGRGS